MSYFRDLHATGDPLRDFPGRKAPNERAALDAEMSISLHFGRHWRRAIEADC